MRVTEQHESPLKSISVHETGICAEVFHALRMEVNNKSPSLQRAARQGRERQQDTTDRTQSQALTTLIQVLGTMVAVVMGVGAVLGALNTMYSAVAERSREIATMRALGFGAGSVVASFVFESLCIALAGGVLGCICTLPLNGWTTGTMNWQSFSHLAFAFRVTPPLIVGGVLFALLMGLAGGVPPALRAARARIAVALREL
jgi:putative ABC transport system permease protein